MSDEARLLAEIHAARALMRASEPARDTSRCPGAAELWAHATRAADGPVDLALVRAIRTDPTTARRYRALLGAQAIAHAPLAAAASEGAVASRRVGPFTLEILPADEDAPPLLVLRGSGARPPRAIEAMLGDETVRLALPPAIDGTILVALDPACRRRRRLGAMLRDRTCAVFLCCDGGMRPAAILVVVPTTGGPVVLRSLKKPPRPAGLPPSRRRLPALPWSGDYARLAAASGPLSRLAGGDAGDKAGPYELRLSGSFDSGRSWEVPVCLAHGLLARGHSLTADPEAADLVLWATGAVDLDLAVLPSDYALLDKLARSRDLLAAAAGPTSPSSSPTGPRRRRPRGRFAPSRGRAPGDPAGGGRIGRPRGSGAPSAFPRPARRTAPPLSRPRSRVLLAITALAADSRCSAHARRRTGRSSPSRHPSPSSPVRPSPPRRSPWRVRPWWRSWPPRRARPAGASSSGPTRQARPGPGGSARPAAGESPRAGPVRPRLPGRGTRHTGDGGPGTRRRRASADPAARRRPGLFPAEGARRNLVYTVQVVTDLKAADAPGTADRLVHGLVP